MNGDGYLEAVEEDDEEDGYGEGDLEGEGEDGEVRYGDGDLEGEGEDDKDGHEDADLEGEGADDEDGQGDGDLEGEVEDVNGHRDEELEEMGEDNDEDEYREGALEGEGEDDEDGYGDEYLEGDGEDDEGSEEVELNGWEEGSAEQCIDNTIIINGLSNIVNTDMKDIRVENVCRCDFSCLEVAYLFYNWYTRLNGFAPRRDRVLRNKNGDIVQQTFVCLREGYTDGRGVSSSS